MHVKDYLFQAGSHVRPDAYWHTTRDGDYLRDTILGHGIVDFEKIMHILLRAGYEGFYSMEYNGLEDAFMTNQADADNLRCMYNRACAAVALT